MEDKNTSEKVEIKEQVVEKEENAGKYRPEEEQYIKVTLDGTGDDGTDCLPSNINIKVNNMTTAQMIVAVMALFEDLVKRFHKDDHQLHTYLGGQMYMNQQRTKMLSALKDAIVKHAENETKEEESCQKK